MIYETEQEFFLDNEEYIVTFLVNFRFHPRIPDSYDTPGSSPWVEVLSYEAIKYPEGKKKEVELLFDEEKFIETNIEDIIYDYNEPPE